MNIPFADAVTLPQTLSAAPWLWVGGAFAAAALLVLAVAAVLRRPRAVDPEAVAATLLRGSADGVLVVDRHGVISQANPVAARLLQRPAAKLVGASAAELLGQRFERRALAQWASEDANGVPRSVRVLYALPPPGGERRLHVTWYALRAHRRLVGHLCLLRDGRHASGGPPRPDNGDSSLDILTGLPGRGRFLQRLERAVVRMYETSGHFDCTLLLINLDRFKQVNDHLGPALADQVLITLSERLAEVAGKAYLARLEGDQFGILVERRERQRDSRQLIDAIKMALERPIKVHAHELRLTASIGVVVNATDYRYAADLLRDARIALAHAKRGGLGQHKVFTREMRAYALKHARIEADLRTALENGELRAVYQPIVDVRRKRVVGFETLIRWRHPEHGEISPGEFIDIAEDSERIVPMGRHIRAVSCERLVEWQRVCNDTGLYLSFNVTDHEIRRPELVTELAGYVGEGRLSPTSVRIEMVERMLLQSDSRRALDQLVALGLPLYIDDFGTGYSSFSRLYETPVHTIKIDRSFVQQMTRSKHGLKIVEAITGLGQSLGVEMIAEGVEELSELRQIEALGCHQVQGYLFAAPLEANVVAASLADQGWIEKRLHRAARVGQ